MADEWLDRLNPAQRQAVVWGEGPLLIVAGAGTGKTRTLASRVAYLIKQGTAPDRILLLTFTRRAAAQMIGQVREIIQTAETSAVWHGTFHSVSNRLLRTYGKAVGLSADFTVMDQGDSADTLNIIRADLGFTRTKKRFPRKVTLNKIYSHTVNAQIALSDVLKKHFPWCMDDQEAIASIFRSYVERKRENNVLDYDDLLLFWRALVTASPVTDTLADRFDHLLVDEYQDTNALQSDIVKGMRKNSTNVAVVGDDAQAIYSFRAATVRNILDFPQLFPGTQVVTLEKNYRSTQPILQASNAVIDQAKERFTKNLYSERQSNQKPILHTCQDDDEQTQAICRRVLDHYEQGIALKEQAVLFRTSHHSAKLEIELTRRNIPFHKYGGLKFVEAAHVKDTMAYLRILENPTDQLSWYRVLLLMKGIGPTNAKRIMEYLLFGRTSDAAANKNATANQPDDNVSDSEPNDGDTSNGGDRVTALRRLIDAPPKVPPAARDSFEALRQVLARCCGFDVDRPDQEPGEPLELASQLELIGKLYEPICEEVYDNTLVRMRDLEQLADIAAGYRSRSRFITDLTLDPPVSTSDFAGAPYLDDDYMILSTIHSAKGCEWTSVHVLHCSDGHIPSDMATADQAGIDEERRLFYVALTRAKDYLYVYFPLRYYLSGNPHSDRHSYAQLTRYIDDSVKPLFEKRFSTRDETMDIESPEGTKAVGKWLDELFDG
ncbi:MAG: ATP-dependent helicase [Planctomycetota bacterium]|jgi:DNA helicase-2/ATP-dependent DNA helicase PcrA